MPEIIAIVEGQTEQVFIRNQLAAHLAGRGVTIYSRLSGKARGHGGVRKWETARRDVIRTLKEKRYVTTMFDFYGLPFDWPGRQEAAGLSWEQKGSCVENAILDDLAAVVGHDFDRRQFIPYVQVHEFEALLFSDVGILAERVACLARCSVGQLSGKLEEICRDAGNPEAINDNYDTCPSRRIAGLVYGYRKLLHGPGVAKAIGLDVIRRQCKHFNEWLEKLESLAS